MGSVAIRGRGEGNTGGGGGIGPRSERVRAAGGLTRTGQHTESKNQHRRRQITTHIIRSCMLPSHHEPFVRGASVMYSGPHGTETVKYNRPSLSLFLSAYPSRLFPLLKFWRVVFLLILIIPEIISLAILLCVYVSLHTFRFNLLLFFEDSFSILKFLLRLSIHVSFTDRRRGRFFSRILSDLPLFLACSMFDSIS